MKVKELKQLLSKYNEGLEVIVYDCSSSDSRKIDGIELDDEPMHPSIVIVINE